MFRCSSRDLEGVCGGIIHVMGISWDAFDLSCHESCFFFVSNASMAIQVYALT